MDDTNPDEQASNLDEGYQNHMNPLSSPEANNFQDNFSSRSYLERSYLKNIGGKEGGCGDSNSLLLLPNIIEQTTSYKNSAQRGKN